jgi:hypothetical protein
MTTTTTPKVALALQAYGFELRLWKEGPEKEWAGTLRLGDSILTHRYEEDNLTLAKLHLLGKARSRAMSLSNGAELPGCDTFMNSWKPVKYLS